MQDTGLIPFRERFPDRFFECGIAEQDMVSQAGGLALAGMLPVVHSFSCFLSTRPNEQIYNNATERTKIVYVGGLAGVLPGGPGHSHQSVREISALGGIPGLVMVEPATPAEVEPLLRWCVEEHKLSSYMRLVSIPVEIAFSAPQDFRPVLGQGVSVHPGRDALLICLRPGDAERGSEGGAGDCQARDLGRGRQPAMAQSHRRNGLPRSLPGGAPSSRSTTITLPADRAR